MLPSRNSVVLPLAVVAVALSGWLCALSQACSCAGEPHPQQAFCGSDVAMKVQLLEKTTEMMAVSNGDNESAMAQLTRYKVNVIKTFKGQEELTRTGYIYSPVGEPSCALDIQPHKRHYILTGRIWSGMIYVTLCNFIRPWNTLSSGQKSGFSDIYGSGCTCQISTCNQKPCEPTEARACTWTDSSTYQGARRWGPQAKTQACLPALEGDGCLWSKINGSGSAEPLDKPVPQQQLQ
ncbi:metalloproteinase inhibitor 3-like [Petromyzon marinus]|uniref:Metalloproteinase inhibitor 3-like n=1 Tax=Petromyzon marinus TaxID=7757 RepID=A0AAJ7WUA1_PETMA|nr:metalloproteinase inhibitor 3-like [Petromyzon marinus]